MNTDTRIKYRADGSIDTAYYIARGRLMRSEAVHRMIGRCTTEPELERPTRRGFLGRILT